MASLNMNAAEETMNIFKNDRNYRPDEVASTLRVSRNTVYRWIRIYSILCLPLEPKITDSFAVPEKT
jgi:transposase